jgi:antitoxin component YwqK of YwqJK toxin-antitoxin module
MLKIRMSLLLFAALFVHAGTVAAVEPSVCGPNAEITYHANGKLKSCGNIQGGFYQGDLVCNGSNTVTFFDNGKVSTCTLALNRSYTVGNIACGESGHITFYESGTLKSCTLKKSAVIDGKKCMESQPVQLHENGKLSSCSEQ